MNVRFIYEDKNQRILNLLNPDQIAYNWNELHIYSWDLVLDDTDKGEIDKDCREYTLVRNINIDSNCSTLYKAPYSNLNRVYNETKSIEYYLDWISNNIKAASENNLFYKWRIF